MKVNVHNLLEAKVLIKEWNNNYSRAEIPEIIFYSHDGELIGVAKWDGDKHVFEAKTQIEYDAEKSGFNLVSKEIMFAKIK